MEQPRVEVQNPHLTVEPVFPNPRRTSQGSRSGVSWGFQRRHVASGRGPRARCLQEEHALATLGWRPGLCILQPRREQGPRTEGGCWHPQPLLLLSHPFGLPESGRFPRGLRDAGGALGQRRSRCRRWVLTCYLLQSPRQPCIAGPLLRPFNQLGGRRRERPSHLPQLHTHPAEGAGIPRREGPHHPA